MEKVIYTQDDYITISENIAEIIMILEENVNIMENFKDNSVDQNTSLAFSSIGIMIDDVLSKTNSYTNELEHFQDNVNEFIEVAEETLKPQSEIVPVRLDVRALTKMFDEIIATFEETLTPQNLEVSEGFLNWVRKTEDELNNSFIDGMFHPRSEWKQRDAENDFRNNKMIMNNVIDGLTEDLTFKEELEELSDFIESIAEFEDIFSESKTKFEANDLYDVFFNEVTGVSKEDFEKNSIEVEYVNENKGTIEGILDSTADMVKEVGYAINPFNWDDVFNGIVQSVSHPIETLKSIKNDFIEMRDTYGWDYAIGYLVPDVASTFIGVSEIKGVSKLSKISNKATKKELKMLNKVKPEFDNFDTRIPEGKQPKNYKLMKGNYGEFTLNYETLKKNILEFEKYDLEPYEGFQNSPMSLTESSTRGIDHIYKNNTPPPEIVIIESKFNTSKLAKLKDGTTQMDKRWIEIRLRDLDIKVKSYDSYLAQISLDGNVSIIKLDENAKKIK